VNRLIAKPEQFASQKPLARSPTREPSRLLFLAGRPDAPAGRKNRRRSNIKALRCRIVSLWVFGSGDGRRNRNTFTKCKTRVTPLTLPWSSGGVGARPRLEFGPPGAWSLARRPAPYGEFRRPEWLSLLRDVGALVSTRLPWWRTFISQHGAAVAMRIRPGAAGRRKLQRTKQMAAVS
jgi:hypothetical protein